MAGISGISVVSGDGATIASTLATHRDAFHRGFAFSLMLFLFRLYSQAYTVALIFWGPFWLLIAYLVYRSTFFPSWLAVPLALEGLGALTLLWPPLATIFPFAIVGGIAELVFMVWLLVRGVDEQRWQERGGETRS